MNPSVQDFLSRQLDDDQLLAKLASSVPSLNHASTLWENVNLRFKGESKRIAPVAQMLLTAFQADNVDGRISLEDLAQMLGEMLEHLSKSELVLMVRNGNLRGKFWINEVELPSLIDDLMFGRFAALPYARGYGRWLRIRLYKHLSQRDYALDLEELGRLADNLELYREELPKYFIDQFEDAAVESFDCIEISSIPAGDDPEPVVEKWLEYLDKIEGYLKKPLDSWKKSELENFLGGIQMQHEWEMEKLKEDRAEHRSESSRGGVLESDTSERIGFTNADLTSMFSSLKK